MEEFDVKLTHKEINALVAYLLFAECEIEDKDMAAAVNMAALKLQKLNEHIFALKVARERATGV